MNYARNIEFLFAALFLATLSAGCSIWPLGGRQMAAQEPMAMDIHEPNLDVFVPIAPAEGSLWSDTGGGRLFVDKTAHQVGDLVTVRISEKPSGSLSADTNTSRESSLNAGIPSLLGYTNALEEKNKRLDVSTMLDASTKSSFAGQGQNNRSGQLDAYVTARVVRVLADGHLYIRGRQEMSVNNETQYVAVSGIIRPEDINARNEIQSTYIAEAKIEYFGKGSIGDAQRAGWLSRLIGAIWPF